MTRAILSVTLAVSALMSVVSCGYALSGKGNSLPAYIKVIAVPQFTNQSRTPDLDVVFTDAVRQEWQSRGKFRIVTESGGPDPVDAVLTVTLQPLILVPIDLTGGVASKYTVTMSANVTFTDEHEKKPFWANPAFRQSDDYAIQNAAIAPDPSALFTADRDALLRLSRSFARSLVTSILEAF